MQELLYTITKGLVEHPEEISITAEEANDHGIVVYHLHVAESDMGRIIGKQGRIAKAIRTVARASVIGRGEKVLVEIG